MDIECFITLAPGVFIPGRPFQHSLTFVSKARVEYLSGAPLKSRLLTFPEKQLNRLEKPEMGEYTYVLGTFVKHDKKFYVCSFLVSI
jgi:hypothetical protein